MASTLLGHPVFDSHTGRYLAMVDPARILIVDDELGPRESLRMILKPSYDVYTAEDGSAALEFLKRRSVDLITLDLKMPGLPGMEVLEEIRKSDPEVLVVIVTGYGTFRSVVDAIRFDVFDYISKPFNVSEILAVVERCLETRDTIRAIRSIFEDIACLAETNCSAFDRARVIREIEEHLGDLDDFEIASKDLGFPEAVKIISDWIEKRDPHMIGHSKRVSRYVDLIARELDLSDAVRDELQIASHLHDIGKVCLSRRFMNGEARLSSTDWAILKQHPAKSVELIGPLNLSETVISAIHHHHERFDGTGYPDGLGGNDISLEARILSIADVYDSVTSERSYRNAMTPVEAETEMLKCTGTYFDPNLTGLFLDVLKKLEISAQNQAPKGNSRREIS